MTPSKYTKIILIIAVFFIFFSITWYFTALYISHNNVPNQIDSQQKVQISESKKDDHPNFVFTFVGESYNPDETLDKEAYTKVNLVYQSKSYPVGEYYGSCWDVELDQLLSGEISGVNCWFAGAGDELRLTKADGVYKVMHRIIETGAPDTDGYFGEYEQVLEVAI